ncbi:MAM and LDL-receptor class A domain-containing protein 1-like [Lytechinus variegatus]|uniref:MAM and LDL-receptor class A domain-containing protein 1-like n=1 Tax=Lytechinus variegatus TaxID=7654 RepID=UPI001BB268CF|nr:MAM and LDL-receptor class A domain-containing protein 1-like [Lytechinus variegatus]
MYVYFEADNGVSNSWADLIGEILSASSGSCLTFWYHMFGNAVGSLEVYTMDEDDQQFGPIWSTSGSQGDVWIMGSADVTFGREFRIVFRATGTDGTEGDIALDDIDIQIGECSDGEGPTAIPVVPMACTFESNLCSYTQLDSDQFDWTRTFWLTDTESTGPSFDHTRGDSNGYYVYIDSTSRTPGDRAQLAAPTQNPTGTGSPKCLVFWYHMYGAEVDRLNVYLRLFKSGVVEDDLIFTKYGSQGNQWIKAEKEITTNYNWMIIYEGINGGQYGDIALDDLNLYDGVCPTQVECDFEVDFCFWTQEPSSSWKWLRNAGSTPSSSTGPSRDHSTGTSFGYYAYVSASTAATGSKALLYSPIYLDTDLECLRFWYHMYGSDLGQLTVYTEDQVTLSNSDPLFIRNGPSDDSWRFGQVSISSSHRYKAVIEATRGDGVQGDIAIDDVEIIRGACPPPGFCDFQSDLCGWSQEVVQDQWDWLRTSGGTDSPNTGPQVDHTYGTGEGFYIYFENSFVTSSNLGQSAILNSEHFSPVDSACLSFWYYMYGDDVGDLEAWMDYTSGQSRKHLWSKEGEEYFAWRNVKIDLSSQSEFRIQLSAVARFVGDQGDIAVDDLDIEMNGCSDIGTAPPMATTKPTAAPVLSICNFEVDWCDFTVLTPNSLSWNRGSGKRSSYSGPSVDHTLGSTSGYYIYLDTSTGSSGDYAQLLSGTITPSSDGVCLLWWYNMNGPDINKLEVWKYGSIKEWVRVGHQGPDWKQGQLFLTGSFRKQDQVLP